MQLILFTRAGCCLCEGLEEKLRSIRLKDLHYKLDLCVKDIDECELTEAEHARYSIEVPVLILQSKEIDQPFELPRVSSRLKKDALLNWLDKQIQGKMDKV